MKFKAENLGEPPEKEEPIDANWLRRGVQAAVKDLPEHEGQIVRVVTVDGDTGSCKCVLRSSGEAIEARTFGTNRNPGTLPPTLIAVDRVN
ncbi:unnamed protein product [Effrenium voratum]|nr:unnamed protein product [Effrenium voratum]